MNNMFAQLKETLNGARPGEPPAGPFVQDGLASILNGKAGLATGAAAGGLAGLLLGGKKGRKLAGNALKIGGVALAGGLAYKAYRDWQANKAPASDGRGYESAAGTPFYPDDAGERESISRIVIRAMIAAAKADGAITQEERERIYDRIGQMSLDAQDLAFIRSEFERPLDIASVARSVATVEQATEVYAASLLAINAEGDAEQVYLRMLARQLQLDAELVKHLHANAEQLAA